MRQKRATSGPGAGALVAVAGLAALVGAAAAFSASQFLDAGDTTARPAEVAETTPVILSPDRAMPTGPMRADVAARLPAADPLADNDPRWAVAAMPELLRPAPTLDEDPVETAFAAPEPKSARAAAPAAQSRAPSSVGTVARVNDDVRLRAGPDNGAAILGVVVRSSTIVVHSCRGWCDVSAGSKRGYVFKKFIDYGKSEAPSGPVTSSVTLTQPGKARQIYQAPTP
ncbi:MAG: SH3 domain-containing protein [Rhizobiaceae bacterium]